jgi:hypothetical protein
MNADHRGFVVEVAAYWVKVLVQSRLGYNPVLCQGISPIKNALLTFFCASSGVTTFTFGAS